MSDRDAELALADSFEKAQFASVFREVADSGTTSIAEETILPEECRLIAAALRSLPSADPDAVRALDVKCRWPACEDDADCMNGCKPAPCSSPADNIDEMHATIAQLHEDLARARDMLGDVPGATLDEALTNYIGSYMALQIECNQLRSPEDTAS